MKKHINKGIALITLLCLCCVSVYATTYYEYNNFRYYYERQHAEDVIVIEKYLGNDAVINVPAYILGDKVTTIDIAAFRDKTNVTEVNLPDTLENIYSSAFKNMSSLTSISIPSSCSSIGPNAFEGCTSLSSVYIDSKPTRIKEFTFKGCTSLENIKIPSSVSSIENYAFANCNNLKTVTVFESVTSISDNAFNNVDDLTIECLEDSYAADYASQKGIKTAPIPVLLGDTNGDGDVDIMDATYIQKYKIGAQGYDLTEYQRRCADVNRDGNVTVRDATLIQMKLAKYDVDF